MKAPVGLLSDRTVCVSRWRGLAPTSSMQVSVEDEIRNHRFVTENIMFRKVRQDDFEKFMTVKHKKSYYLAQIDVYLTFLLKRCPFYAAASVTA